MRTRTSPVVLGFIWGLFSMLLSFAVVSVFASLQVVFTGFPMFAYNGETQYIIIGAIFLLSVIGAIGAGLVPRLPKLGGFCILLSCCGVALLLITPILMQSFSLAPLEAYGITVTPLALLITDFALIIFTFIGLLGGILAFIPKKDRKAIMPMIPQTPYVPTTAAQPQPIVQPPAQPAPAPEPVAPTIVPSVQPEIIHADTAPTDIDMTNLE